MDNNSSQKPLWTLVMTFNLPQDAYLPKAFLESEGITVFLKDENTIQVFNFYSSAVGGVKMLVPTSQAERAIKLLQDGGYLERKSFRT